MISQYSPRAVRIASAVTRAVRFDHTHLMISYSIAFLASVGRAAGNGDGSSDPAWSSDSEEYSDSSSDPDSLSDEDDESD